jgi:hypothetical protein
MTTFLSSLFSPARGQDEEFPGFSMVGWFGFNTRRLGVEPDSVLQVPLSNFPSSRVCIVEESQDCKTTVSSLPDGTRLTSTNEAVVSVSSDTSGVFIQLKSVGSATLQLRQNGKILASYVYVVTPNIPGTTCFGNEQLNTDPPDSLVADCSGACVSRFEIEARLSDSTCDNGTPRPDGKPPIDLSCAAFNEGCNSDQRCIAQFGTAPGFELCSASANLCWFNATTRRGDTCADICQQFGSSCVAALDNKNAGCTPDPENRDTCSKKQGGQTSICVCERR